MKIYFDGCIGESHVTDSVNTFNTTEMDVARKVVEFDITVKEEVV